MIIKTKFNVGDEIWIARRFDPVIKWPIKQIHVVVYDHITRIVYEFENGHSEREERCFSEYEQAGNKKKELISKSKK